MAKSDQLVRILDGCTSLDKSNIKDLIQQGNITTLKNSISGPVNVSDINERFLGNYRRALERKKEKARKIKLIKNNFSRIEDIFDELQEEVNRAKDEERTLEELADDFENKDVQEKIESYDKPEIDKLNKKLKHLISLKKEMENREQTLEQITSSYSNISEAVEQRIDLTTDIINKAGSGAGSTNPKIISISDVRGSYGEYEGTKHLLNDSNCSFPSLSNGEYKIVLNGNAFDYNNKDRGSEEMLDEIERKGGNGNLEYIFGHMDQFILFKEFWSAVEGGPSPDNDGNPFHIKMGENKRLNFIKQIYEDDGYIKGLSRGKYQYNYANASPAPDGKTNQRLKEAAGAIFDLKLKEEPKDLITASEFNRAVSEMKSKFSGINTDKSDHKLDSIMIHGRPMTPIGDLDFSDPNNSGNIEALIAIQYLIQFGSWSELSFDDCNKIFDPNNGTLWRKWPALVSGGNPGKLIVGRTLNSDCAGEGNSMFGGSNPREANGGDQINERTISTGDPNCVIVEEPGGELTAVRRDPGSGDIEEEQV
ncbi:hypothetical protein GLU64_02205 [Nanohaloarchaea archaeon]|nr:hypothetical protein [Candidatus Nanohaloarchaea archaeon]